jgi:hypothetical protein
MSAIIRATVRHSNDKYATPDPVAIEQAIGGRKPRLYPLEMRRVVAHLTDRGWSARAIAEHIGTTDRAVVRHRLRLREEVTR